jgi:hypothetical protein
VVDNTNEGKLKFNLVVKLKRTATEIFSLLRHAHVKMEELLRRPHNIISGDVSRRGRATVIGL